MLAHDYPVTVACEILGLARSTYYYEAQEQDEAAAETAIQAVVAEWPTYGYRRLTAQLQRQGWDINHKRVQRLMQELDLSLPVKRKAHRTTNSVHGYPPLSDWSKTSPWCGLTRCGARISPTSGCTLSSSTWP